MRKKWWVSWFWPPDLGSFTLYWPWWISGSRVTLDKNDRIKEEEHTICAAIQAESEEAAMGIVIACFDEKPKAMEWRFVEEKPDDWSPFCDRFPRADWMLWPEEHCHER